MHGSELALNSWGSHATVSQNRGNSTHEIIMFRALQMDVTPVHCSTHTTHRPAVQLHTACVSLSTEGLMTNGALIGGGRRGQVHHSHNLFFEFASASAAISTPTMLW
jgi:hypothetical protein